MRFRDYCHTARNHLILSATLSTKYSLHRKIHIYISLAKRYENESEIRQRLVTTELLKEETTVMKMNEINLPEMQLHRTLEHITHLIFGNTRPRNFDFGIRCPLINKPLR
jgi:hypothetical protein